MPPAIAPHSCQTGLKCTNRIEDLSYLTRRLTHLNAVAREAGITVHNNTGDLRYLRMEATSLEWELALRGIDAMKALAAIQTPEYWQVEIEYLKNEGCLERPRQLDTSPVGDGATRPTDDRTIPTPQGICLYPTPDRSPVKKAIGGRRRRKRSRLQVSNAPKIRKSSPRPRRSVKPRDAGIASRTRSRHNLESREIRDLGLL